MVDKKFLQYLTDNRQSGYKYTVKLAVPEINDAQIDSIERVLEKYHLKSASDFRKTPIQESPLDFPTVKNMPVFICDIELEYPTTIDSLCNMIAGAMGVSRTQTAAFSENDPLKISRDLFDFRRSEEFKDGYEPVTGADYPDEDHSDLYGEKFNSQFLKELGEKPRPAHQYHGDIPEGDKTYARGEEPSHQHEITMFGRIKHFNKKEIK